MPSKSRHHSKSHKKRIPRKTYKRTYKSKTQQAKKQVGLLRIQTLQPKEVYVSIPYNQVIRYTTNGTYGGGPIAPNNLRINLNYPLAAVNAPFGGIVKDLDADVAYSATFTKDNADGNLRDKLEPFFGPHSRCMVVRSKCTVQYTQQLNQHKLEQWLSNENAAGNNSGDTALSWETNHPAYLKVNDATLDGDVFVAQHKSSTAIGPAQRPFKTATTLHDLKTKVTGLQMRNVKCRKETIKGVKFSCVYTPRKDLMIKDIDDNQGTLNFSMGSTAAGDSAPGKQVYNNIAYFNKTQVSGANPSKLPLFDVQIRVMYDLKFSRRNNLLDENVPIPHTAQTPRQEAFQ